MPPSPLDPNRSAAGGAVSPQPRMHSRSRTQSISSDRPSTVAHSMMSPPLTVSPEAAFIAASAASQIVSNDHGSHADTWYDQHGIEPSNEAAVVSSAALQLVNNFLDQLLFNFLLVARSTTLAALRPAVSEVLKPKLAKDAINQADEELREYLGGDDEDPTSAQDPGSPSDWDLELVWKRTRLRCMVYSSLGDMEEEDEDYYMEKEHLEPGFGDRSPSEVVSPAVAIFLTSILEFMGEQALVIAGQAAYHRMRAKHEKELKEGARSPMDTADRVLVEELDMERVALDRTLGRLWRAWKKKIRSPGVTSIESNLVRSFSRDSMRQSHLRSPSTNAEMAVPPTVQEPDAEIEVGDRKEQQQDGEEEKRASVQQPTEGPVDPAAIALPMGANDVAEIEVPGLVSYDSDVEADEKEQLRSLPVRPKSIMVFPTTGVHMPPTPTFSLPRTPPLGPRKRSNSLPTPAATPYDSPAKRQRVTPEDEDDGAIGDDENKTVVEDATPKAADQFSAPELAPIYSEGLEAVAEEPELPSDDATVNEAPVPGRDAESVAEAEDEAETSEEEFIDEEPQILTSSRISISGRSSSPAASDVGMKPGPINTNLPVRTPSIHSARLIDVAPRSPATTARGSPVDFPEHVRQSSLSRTSSVRTAPIGDERQRSSSDVTSAPRQDITSAPKAEITSAPRPSPGHPSRSALANSESISETEEGSPVEMEVSPVTPLERGLETIAEPDSRESYEDQMETPRQIFGSVAARNSAPSSPARTVSPAKLTTKIIVSSPKHSGTFLIEDKPVLPPKSPLKSRPAISATLPQSPPVPDRSPGRRQVYANTSAQLQGPSTIGLPSVEHTRNRSPSEPASAFKRSQERQNSGSTTSSLSTKLKPLRTSEEAAPTPSPADLARNFEDLIQSDQTIQYTLTPESMRDFDSQSMRSFGASGSPIIAVKRKSEDARQQGSQTAGGSSSSLTRSSEMKRSNSVSNSNGVNANSSVPRSASHGVGTMPPKPRNPPQARDARLPRESLADFAEFIRSTGPPGAPPSGMTMPGGRPTAATALRANPPGPSQIPITVQAQQAQQQAQQQVQSPRGHTPINSLSRSDGRLSTAVSTTSSHNPNRPRLQARDAAVDYRDDNSDLIDFIRRGPPAAGGQPRIPRTVAPFRTTMDSDQMAGAVGGVAVDATFGDVEAEVSGYSNRVDSLVSKGSEEYGAPTAGGATPSIQSSITSQSALLGGRNKALPSTGSGGAITGNGVSNNRFGGGGGYGAVGGGGMGMGNDDMPMPQRKTRRVRDPYAIDLTDEEDGFEDDEDDDLFPPKPKKKPQTQEESLMDFLRNVPPPPPSGPVRLQTTLSHGQSGSSHSQLQKPQPKKKASAPSLMARFTRRESRASGNPPSTPSSPKSPPTAQRTESRGLSSRASTGTSGSKYIPLQVNMPPGVDKYAPLPANNNSSNGGGRLGTGYGDVSGTGGVPGQRRVPMKKFEPREAVSVPTRGTSDLAEFLRSSEPPPGMVASNSFAGDEREQQPQNGSLSKMFNRRRKGSVI